jgi:hypothetical protein
MPWIIGEKNNFTTLLCESIGQEFEGWKIPDNEDDYYNYNKWIICADTPTREIIQKSRHMNYTWIQIVPINDTILPFYTKKVAHSDLDSVEWNETEKRVVEEGGRIIRCDLLFPPPSSCKKIIKNKKNNNSVSTSTVDFTCHPSLWLHLFETRKEVCKVRTDKMWNGITIRELFTFTF